MCPEYSGDPLQPKISPGQPPWHPAPAHRAAPFLECVQVHLFSVALKIVEEHSPPVQSLPVLADYDVLQIAGSIQAGQGQDETRFGYYQVQFDIIVAVQLYSPVQGGVFEGMALEPQLLEDPIRGDDLTAERSAMPPNGMTPQRPRTE